MFYCDVHVSCVFYTKKEPSVHPSARHSVSTQSLSRLVCLSTRILVIESIKQNQELLSDKGLTVNRFYLQVLKADNNSPIMCVTKSARQDFLVGIYSFGLQEVN